MKTSRRYFRLIKKDVSSLFVGNNLDSNRLRNIRFHSMKTRITTASLEAALEMMIRETF